MTHLKITPEIVIGRRHVNRWLLAAGSAGLVALITGCATDDSDDSGSYDSAPAPSDDGYQEQQQRDDDDFSRQQQGEDDQLQQEGENDNSEDDGE